MEKKYIIKDARDTLAHQLEATGTMEKEPMSESPIKNTKGLSAAIPKDSEGYCTVYKLDCSDGLGLMTVYQVYPGIQLIYNDFEAAGCEWDSVVGGDVLEINHCREGREGSRLLGLV